jgi:hypothetical protein
MLIYYENDHKEECTAPNIAIMKNNDVLFVAIVITLSHNKSTAQL